MKQNKKIISKFLDRSNFLSGASLGLFYHSSIMLFVSENKI